METIDIFIKCYYELDHKNRCFSANSCKLAWEYLLSDAQFSNLLRQSIMYIDNSNQQSGQSFSQLYIDIFYNEEINQLSVILNFYTKEGSAWKPNSFKITFDDITRNVDTAKKGKTLRKILQNEKEMLISKVTDRYQLLLGIILAVTILPIVCALTVSFYFFIVAAFGFLFMYGILQDSFEYLVKRYLPKNNEYKTSYSLL